MQAGLQIALSGALTFGLPLIVAVHELILLRRPQRGGWGGDGPRMPDPRPLPGLTPKTLPACLIPNLPPIRPPARVPERV